ncbi:hypothetical protein MNBD_GAMMA16-668 [hydrothermal vent metagenome]|uniref:Sulfotransferase n=1 Tax=hydrothermal vent metagenome TaxID=652676 RepID=A0A3B0ZLU6_9ZZZZ
MSKKSPVFIFGSARSGTSLLSRIVGNHPNIAVPFESHLYNTFYPWLKLYGDLHKAENRRRLVQDILSTADLLDWTPRPIEVKTLEAIERYDFHGVVDALMMEWTKLSGKQRWGEKTPWHIYYWREILEGFPDMKVIHIVRDGRDASLSWQNARFGPKHIYHLAIRWKGYLAHVAELQKEIKPEQFFELRYEDLLDNSEKITKNICEFLGEEFSVDMLGFYRENVIYPTDKKNLLNLSQPLIKNNKNKWRKTMKQREIRIFEAVAGDMLKKYNYDCVVDTPVISNFEKVIMKYIEHPPRRVVAMLKNTKGLRDAARLWRIYLCLRLGIESPWRKNE